MVNTGWRLRRRNDFDTVESVTRNDLTDFTRVDILPEGRSASLPGFWQEPRRMITVNAMILHLFSSQNIQTEDSVLHKSVEMEYNNMKIGDGPVS